MVYSGFVNPIFCPKICIRVYLEKLYFTYIHVGIFSRTWDISFGY